MKKFFIILAVALSGFSYLGCNNAKKADKQSETLIFGCVNFDTVANLTKDANSPKCSISIKLHYAMGPNASIINDSILNSGILPEEELKRGAKKTVPRAVEIFTKNYVKKYKGLAKENLKSNDPEIGALEQEFSLESSFDYGKDSIINYLAHSYSYSGGANGLSVSVAMNFDPKTGKMLKIKDIMTNGAEDKITECIVNKMYKKYDVENLDGLKDNGFFDIFEPYVPENFVYGKDSITFIYEADEIGPVSYGQIKTTFAYGELEGLIK